MNERRSQSLSARFFRFTSRKDVVRGAALAIVGGWLCLFTAHSHAMDSATPATLTEGVPTHNVIDWAPVAGGALMFMGIFAGISRWVAEPAARKVMHEHQKLGASAHPELVPRAEWDNKHANLVDRVSEIQGDIRALVAATQTKKQH